jgi:hypothetical protein
MSNSPVILNIVGAEGSGKGLLLRSARDMGDHYIDIIKKATTRKPQLTDTGELEFYESVDSFHDKYNIIYGNYKHHYGISTSDIWHAISIGKVAFLINSNFSGATQRGEVYKDDIGAVQLLKAEFGPLFKLIYIHTDISRDEIVKHSQIIDVKEPDVVALKADKALTVASYFTDNIEAFDHVLLNVRAPEDLSDQLFRLTMLYLGKL